MTMRRGVVARARVLIATPDIVHAWLLPNVGVPSIRRFFENLSLIVVDEIHTYAGVFGSNAAFLFRRLQHVMKELGSDAQYVCASATIAEPLRHLASLFGPQFSVVGQEFDTSPTHRVDVQLVEAPGSSDFLSELSKLLYSIAAATSHNFLTFVDSRKQTEHITSIINRWKDMDTKGEPEADGKTSDIGHLHQLDVLPFRAGYEAYDRNIIQERLTKGTVRGVVSTSALELGIDIPHLTLGVLVGVPQSSTSLLQRIGRIGRRADGTVLIINTGDVYDELVFRRPDELLRRPMAECALYLENPRIQYIGALCLARQGGEHDLASGSRVDPGESGFETTVSWPSGFVDLCNAERLGQIGPEFQAMKMEAGDDPNHTYPLRDVESQFRVVW
jgi:DEAD/DEAH box helicase domain-containing protein